jgi:hypothetical protein
MLNSKHDLGYSVRSRWITEASGSNELIRGKCHKKRSASVLTLVRSSSISAINIKTFTNLISG